MTSCRTCGNVIYDPTFFVQTGKYDDQTRTFCTNQGGFVSLESYSDFVCVNGHAYHDRKSTNTNFAFLSKVVLTEPVTDNQAYGEAIGRLATLIGGGKTDPAAFRRPEAGPSQHLEPHPQRVHRTDAHQRGVR